MKIALGCDHGGFPAKAAVLESLRQHGADVEDLGCFDTRSVDYPDYAREVSARIVDGRAERGVLICTTGTGMAIAAKRDGLPYRVFAMAGDGEMDEGLVWEAMMTANKYTLDNFILILDNNGLQLDGPCDVVMPPLDMSAKAAAFGFETYDIDGHDFAQILDTFDKIRQSQNGRPKFINAKTVKGKWVDFMENKLEWHGTAPNAEQYADAMRQLERGRN